MNKSLNWEVSWSAGAAITKYQSLGDLNLFLTVLETGRSKTKVLADSASEWEPASWSTVCCHLSVSSPGWGQGAGKEGEKEKELSPPVSSNPHLMTSSKPDHLLAPSHWALGFQHVNFVGFPGGSVVKSLLASAGDSSLIPGSRGSPGEGNGNQSSSLAWEIPWAEEPGGLQSMGLQRVRHNLVTKQYLGSHCHPHWGWGGHIQFLRGKEGGSTRETSQSTSTRYMISVFDHPSHSALGNQEDSSCWLET